jgi:hypothetical protein
MTKHTTSTNNKSWYPLKLLKSARENYKCVKVIGKMEKHGLDPKEHKYCTRGLERMTGARMDRKEQNRLDAYIAVMDVQDAQWEQGYEDQEQIAKHYRTVSYQCQMEARKMNWSF